MDPAEEDHQALRAMKALFEQAVHENNLDILRPHLDEHFSIVTFTNREFSDFDAFKTQWQKTRDKMLKGGSYSVEILPERSQLLGDIALACGDSANTLVTGSGREFKFGSRWTVVFHKVAGQWKIRRAHSSISPFDNPMLVAGVKKKALQVAIIALVVGAALGFAAAQLFRMH